MMEWRPKGYLFDTNNLIRALFDEILLKGNYWMRQMLDTSKYLPNQNRGMPYYG